MTTRNRNLRANLVRFAACAVVLAGATATMTGCRGDRTDKPPRRFFPDMDYQPKLKPQSETEFWANDSSQRLPVERTVAYGANPHDPNAIATAEWADQIRADRERKLGADESFSFGLVSGSTADEPIYVQRMPVEVTADLIARGQERFDIYCSACHGYTGESDGTVGKLWSYSPANLLGEAYRDRASETGSDGYLFHVIREGLWSPDGSNRMPAYKHAVSESDAWAIVSYLRVLQASQGVPFDSLSPADQARLESQGGQP